MPLLAVPLKLELALLHRLFRLELVTPSELTLDFLKIIKIDRILDPLNPHFLLSITCLTDVVTVAHIRVTRVTRLVGPLIPDTDVIVIGIVGHITNASLF